MLTCYHISSAATCDVFEMLPDLTGCLFCHFLPLILFLCHPSSDSWISSKIGTFFQLEDDSQENCFNIHVHVRIYTEKGQKKMLLGTCTCPHVLLVLLSPQALFQQPSLGYMHLLYVFVIRKLARQVQILRRSQSLGFYTTGIWKSQCKLESTEPKPKGVPRVLSGPEP